MSIMDHPEFEPSWAPKRLRLPAAVDAAHRVLVRDLDGARMWRTLSTIQDGDHVVEIAKGFALLGNGKRISLSAFRWAK